MGGMEFNKIFAAILVAGIIAMFGGFVAKKLVHPHELEQNAFNVEVIEDAGAGGAAKPKGPEPIMALIAAADIAKGEKIAKACAACHSFNKGGANGVGPNLWGVVGGPKHHAAGFSYSGALIEHGGKTWSYDSLNKFLYKPKDYAPGTKMSYAGLKKTEDRVALVAWLRTQADSQFALPSEGEIAAEVAELAPPVAEVVPVVVEGGAGAATPEGVLVESPTAATITPVATPAADPKAKH